jgi:ketosteroid isomerase-like protein
MGDASAFMKPVKIFPLVETILKLDAAGHLAYKRFPSLQMRATPSICAHPRSLGGASVLDDGFGVAPKRTFVEISLAVVARNAQGKSAMARAPSSACVTRALPGTARFMRTIAIAFWILMAMTICAAPEQPSSAIARIQSVLRAQQDAWNRGDIDAFMNGYARSESTVFISEDTIRRGWQTVRDRYRKKYSSRVKMGTLTFSDLEIMLLSSDSAVAYGRWQLKRGNDQPHGRFTLILKRLPEGWRIVHDHTSAASPPR